MLQNPASLLILVTTKPNNKLFHGSHGSFKPQRFSKIKLQYLQKEIKKNQESLVNA